MKKGITKIIPLFIVILFSLFFFLLKNIKNQNIIEENITAKHIMEQFKKISYGKEKILTNHIIVEGGSYYLKGNMDCITINTKDYVQLILDDANITCTKGPAIYIKDSSLTNIVLKNKNKIHAITTQDLNSAIYSQDTIMFSGDGKLHITSNYDGIISKSSILFENGEYTLVTNGDGIQGKDRILIRDGIYNLDVRKDGFKTTDDSNVHKGNIVIDDGSFKINAKGDGLSSISKLILHNGKYEIYTLGNANQSSTKGIKSKKLIQIEDGEYKIVSNDDTIHSNKDILIMGGYSILNSSDDGIQADGTIQIKNGNLIIQAKEGLESTTMIIQGGKMNITSSKKGITVKNRNPNNETYFTMSDGIVEITLKNKNDCAIDSTKTINISGGELNLNSNYPLCYSETATYSGGIIRVNGKEIQKITEIKGKKKT